MQIEDDYDSLVLYDGHYDDVRGSDATERIAITNKIMDSLEVKSFKELETAVRNASFFSDHALHRQL